MSLLLEALGALVAPERCAACDERVPAGMVFCIACAATACALANPSAPLECVETLHAPFSYGGAMATAITRFKYEGRRELARPLGHLLLRALPWLRPLQIDVVVPVPLHGSRLVERGFNQAALLARPLARRLGAAFAARALTRVRPTDPQAALSQGARLQNVRGAFEARSPAFFEGLRVLLVDDVATTGATLAQAAIAARMSRARIVHAVVLARA